VRRVGVSALGAEKDGGVARTDGGIWSRCGGSAWLR